MQITKEHIDIAQLYGACSEALEWLRERPRTWRDLVERRPDWAAWVMVRRSDWPINLDGLSSYNRAWVMAKRPDCPINLKGLDDVDRARVMARRLDCPINLDGLNSYNRAKVMIGRPDCPVNLDGLDSVHRAWVVAERSKLEKNHANN